MRCAICGFGTTSEVPSPTGQGPAYKCWRQGHIFAIFGGRPVTLVPGPHETTDQIGEAKVVPCLTCDCPAICRDAEGINPVYACLDSGHQFQFDTTISQ